VQLRDFEGYAETRRQLLVGKSIQANWITYAIAAFLSGDYPRALEVLHSFLKTLKDDKAAEKLKRHDRTELSLFEARIYEAMGDNAKALEVLTKEGVILVN
jgi:tetratricopeptide (TPR) repeat protein